VSRLEDLPADLRAALALVVGRRKRYAEIAALLQIEERAVHDRAHAALALLAPRQARALEAAQRERVGEYLLGQASAEQHAATAAYIERSDAARAWAAALAGELAPLAGELPETPAGAPTVNGDAPAPPGEGDVALVSGAGEAPGSPREGPSPGSRGDDGAATSPVEDGAATSPVEDGAATSPVEETIPAPDGPSSRRGGAILLAALGAVVAIAVVLIVALGGGSSPSAPAAASDAGTQSAASGASSAASTTAAGGTSSTATAPAASTTPSASAKSGGKSASEPHLEATLPLAPPDSSSKALGLVEVVSEGDEHAFIIAAEHLPPTQGFHYAAWLYNTPDDASFLGGGTMVGANGTLKAAAPLPADATRYATFVLTEEHEQRPKQPGPIVLSGPFKE
jgi:hypothetical protein